MPHPSPAVPPAAIGRWPVASDPGPVPPRGVAADPIAALFVVLAGLGALLTWVLSCYPVGDSLIAQTGAKTFRDLRGLVDSSASYELTALGILTTAVAGGALVLLGLALLLPINHRPLGTAALVLAALLTAAALWHLVQGREVMNLAIADLVTLSHPAWLLTAVAALLAWVGTVRSLVVG